MSALTEEAVSPFTIRMVQWLPIFPTPREVTQYYAMERFLYRLSTSPHVEIFTLSGALLLTAWQLPSPGHRWTLIFLVVRITPWRRSLCSCARSPTWQLQMSVLLCEADLARGAFPHCPKLSPKLGEVRGNSEGEIVFSCVGN